VAIGAGIVAGIGLLWLYNNMEDQATISKRKGSEESHKNNESETKKK
jgi:hypothetical protein